jgi:hypothetical protein
MENRSNALRERNAMSKQKPAHEIRLGRVKATIWENETDQGTSHLALNRRYALRTADLPGSYPISRMMSMAFWKSCSA